MRRLIPLLLLALATSACPSYDEYSPVVSQDDWSRGLFARYGRSRRRRSRSGTVRRRLGRSPADWAAQADAAIAYARTLPDVATIVADTLGHRLTVQFKSGWRTAVLPIDDGRRGAETPGIAAAAPAP
jgi:hypothetical protein